MAAHEDLTSLTLRLPGMLLYFRWPNTNTANCICVTCRSMRNCLFLIACTVVYYRTHSNTKQSGSTSFVGKTIPVCIKLGSARHADNTEGMELLLFRWQSVLAC